MAKTHAESCVGAASRGLYRVHQFSKVEMFVLSTPEQSEALLEELTSIEKEMFTELGLHFKILVQYFVLITSALVTNKVVLIHKCPCSKVPLQSHSCDVFPILVSLQQERPYVECPCTKKSLYVDVWPPLAFGGIEICC